MGLMECTVFPSVTHVASYLNQNILFCLIPSVTFLSDHNVYGVMKDKTQNAFGATTCNVCGMLYTPSTTEDETQHLLFHNQFISAVRYVVCISAYVIAYYSHSDEFWLKYQACVCKTGLIDLPFNIRRVFGCNDFSPVYSESFTGLEEGEDFRGISRWQDYPGSPRRS